ncbi:hypothetical protein HMPREF1624_03801 [Sporothrix schenckii ATCC 58251]|uniref:DUF3533 domain-containing protein n=1 Tax=Sporothrix schenckii (strain ATCC 58251 / de Perez 2211183) TaxID=1391915 RepID=U7Q0E2_SPOS1|nr:hypothetical protein HMPREF1624_03801 [Sporothrix schenckii ATCC 58251]
MKRLYPKATQNRLRFGQHGFQHTHAFLRAVLTNFVLLQLLFLGLFCYIFGSLFQQTQHTHNLTILFVDYDQGAIGRAVRTAYASLASDSFPTLVEQPPSAYPAPAADLATAVCATDYWAALYVAAGASARLQAALRDSNSTAAQNYNATDALFYTWDEARYPTVEDPAVAGSLQTLADDARGAYVAADNGSLVPWPLGSPAAAAVLVTPWTLTATDLQPTPQGSRAIYNTLVIILILIQEFFYLGTINGLYASFHIYSRIHPARVIAVRTGNSLAYTCVGALCTVGAIWAFRAGWPVGGAQFTESWMALWLFAHLNFLTLDVFTVWLPLPYVPMALISWVVVNVTSILLPFELSPAFYRVGYALPAHNVYQVLLDVWSLGCNRPQLHIALPVLFAWEVASFILSALGVYRRSHYAALADEAQARELRERVDAALALKQTPAEEEAATATTADKEGTVPAGPSPAAARAPDAASRTATRRDNQALRREVTQAISRENQQIQREQQLAGRMCRFGPSFDLAFGPGADDSRRSSDIDEGDDGEQVEDRP